MAGGGFPSEVEVAVLLEKVREDRRLPQHLRERVRRAAGDLEHPSRALSRMQELARRELPNLPRARPRVGLARVVTAGTFLRHHTEPTFRETFATTDDFVRYVSTSDQPDAELWNNFSVAPIAVPWERSRLAPLALLEGRSGGQLIQALELGSDAEPPFVLLRMPLRRLLQTGVAVRPPCSLDSSLGPHWQWSPTGLASGIDEYVDGDVPRAAIASLKWVP